MQPEFVPLWVKCAAIIIGVASLYIVTFAILADRARRQEDADSMQYWETYDQRDEISWDDLGDTAYHSQSGEMPWEMRDSDGDPFKEPSPVE